MKLSMIVARSMDNVIGINNDIPWKCPEDMALFKQLTSGENKAIVMGRNTWNSLPVRPLPGRSNIVISSDFTAMLPETKAGFQLTLHTPSIQETIGFCKESGIEELIFIGGKAIYEEAVKIVDEVYLTEMNWNTLSDNVTGPEDQKVYFDYHFAYSPANPDQEWVLVENWEMLEGGTGKSLFDFFHFKRK